MRFKISARNEIHEAEAPRIVVGDDPAVIQMQDDVVVPGILGALEMEGARSRRLRGLDAERAGHSEMREQRCPVVELEQKIFGAPRQPDDPPSRQALPEAGRKWKTNVPPPHLDAFDAGAGHRRLEAAPNGFDLGQFRHADGPE